LIRTLLAATFLLFSALPADAAAGRSVPTVQIVVVAGADPARAFFEVLRELLGRHAVDVSTAWDERLDLSSILQEQAPTPGLLARVYIDLSDGKEVGIYLLDAGSTRALIRSVATSGGQVDELAREAAAHIVEAAVTALLSGATIGMPRLEARRQLGLETTPAVVAVVPVAAPQRLRWEIAPTYSVGLWSGGAGSVIHGPGLSFALGGSTPRAWGGRVHLGLSLPHDDENAGVRAEFFDIAPRVLGTFEHRISGGVAVEAAMGPGCDLTFVSATATSPSVGVDRKQSIIDPVWAVQAGVSVDLGDRLWLAVRGTLDIDLADTRYVVELAPGRGTVADPWRLRPGLQLAFGFRNN